MVAEKMCILNVQRDGLGIRLITLKELLVRYAGIHLEICQWKTLGELHKISKIRCFKTRLKNQKRIFRKNIKREQLLLPKSSIVKAVKGLYRSNMVISNTNVYSVQKFKYVNHASKAHFITIINLCIRRRLRLIGNLL